MAAGAGTPATQLGITERLSCLCSLAHQLMRIHHTEASAGDLAFVCRMQKAHNLSARAFGKVKVCYETLLLRIIHHFKA